MPSVSVQHRVIKGPEPSMEINKTGMAFEWGLVSGDLVEWG